MKRVLVFGDVIEDVYRECAYLKQCPDSPETPVYLEGQVTSIPGGAANVALNISALDPDVCVDLIGFIGARLCRIIKQRSRNLVSMAYGQIGFDDDALRKERLVIDGRLVHRIDDRVTLSESDQDWLNAELQTYLTHETPDLIVVADYGGGAINPRSIELLMRRRERVLVDTKAVDLSPFAGCQLIKLNAQEYERVLAKDHSPERHTGFLVVTSGAQGALLIIREDVDPRTSKVHRFHSPAFQAAAVDVCGCGDTFMAGLTHSLLQSTDMYNAVRVGNAAAATVVSQPRTAVVDRNRMLELLGRNTDEARR